MQHGSARAIGIVVGWPSYHVYDWRAYAQHYGALAIDGDGEYYR